MRKPDPVEIAAEIVHAWIPAAVQAVVVAFAVGVAMLAIVILRTPAVPV